MKCGIQVVNLANLCTAKRYKSLNDGDLGATSLSVRL